MQSSRNLTDIQSDQIFDKGYRMRKRINNHRRRRTTRPINAER